MTLLTLHILGGVMLFQPDQAEHGVESCGQLAVQVLESIPEPLSIPSSMASLALLLLS